MTVVVDANLIAALLIPLPYSVAAAERYASWQREEEEVLTPWLLVYEVDTTLRKAQRAGLISEAGTVEARRRLPGLGMRFFRPTIALSRRALYWSSQLHQAKVYDAHYLALAEREGATLWTADRRLRNNAQEVGAVWVKWIEEPI